MDIFDKRRLKLRNYLLKNKEQVKKDLEEMKKLSKKSLFKRFFPQLEIFKKISKFFSSLNPHPIGNLSDLTQNEFNSLINETNKKDKLKEWISVSSGIFPETHSMHGDTYESDEVVVYINGEKEFDRYIRVHDKYTRKKIFEGWLSVYTGENCHGDITHYINVGNPILN